MMRNRKGRERKRRKVTQEEKKNGEREAVLEEFLTDR